MDNAEEILQSLEEFSKLKPKDIPKELDDYLGYVAKTGDPVYQWHLIKSLFHEKLANVITEFYETSPSIDLPPCPNVDTFNYERMKTSLLERLDTFSSAPFTVQRICELLTSPKKQYNRVDKFMRAVEKNILVVSTREPGIGKRSEFDQTESVLNINGVPDNRDHEIDADRVNMCSDNLTPNNSTCSPPPIPVENAVNACLIQEEIEIAHTASSTAMQEDKSWVDSSERQVGGLDSVSDNSNVEKTEENSIISDNSNSNLPVEVDVTKVDIVTTTSNDLEKASSLIVLESKEVELDTKDVTASDQIETTEISPTPDSPASPEPSSEDVLCDASSDDSDVSPEKQSVIEESDFQIEEDSNLQCSEVVSENKIETESVQPETLSEESNIVIESCEEEEEEEEEQQQPITAGKQLSPSCTMADTSNDCFTGRPAMEAVGLSGTIVYPEEPEEEEEVMPGLVDVASPPVQEEDQEEFTETTVESAEEFTEATVESSEELLKSEEKVPDEITEAEGEPKISTDPSTESVSIEEVTDVKEGEEVNAEAVETCGKVSEETNEEERRESGSVIHETPVACVEQESKVPEPVAEAPVAVAAATPQAVVEDICVDQSSCGSEEEAMDVDESSSQQMATSESEMNEDGEPMDQSEQPQS